jgi:hypothetical protein
VAVGDFGRWKNRTHRLVEGSVLTDGKRAKKQRWSESEKEAPIIKEAAYKLKRGPGEAGKVGVGIHIWRLMR